MEIEVLERENRKIRLLIQGTNVPFMNAVRRTIIREVPCMAIDEVVMIENSSVLQDEIIAHRLGLIPLKTDLDSYNLPEECSCKSEFGCSLCRVSLTLEVDAKEATTTIYSGKLTSENPSITPVSDEIPIVKLAKQQSIKLEAYARLGSGKDHAKWQPTSMCTYKYFPQIAISKQCDACGKCVDICPRKVLIKAGETIEIRDLMACTLCEDCIDVCPKNPPAIAASWKDGVFIFNIESTEVLPPERILKEALKIMREQLKQFTSQVKVK